MQHLSDITTDIEERRNEASDGAKYELLLKRDQEMTEFIDRFGELHEKEVAEQKRMHNTVVALLEHISEGMEREKVMPSREQAEEMKEDLQDKNREYKASVMTSERLQEELTLRQTELEKINTLDERIVGELKMMNERMEAMRAELSKYRDLEGVRTAGAKVKEELRGKLAAYTQRRDMLRVRVQAAAMDVEKKKAALARDTNATALESIEAKLKNQEQALFVVKECTCIALSQ
ncbi:hypothetical protein EON66_09615 [archaeon]|nr:MAG: hypothetical protein EON66_09615 [archaeon]